MFPYLVCEFGKGALSNLVKECFGTDFPDIIKKKQINYIFNYLKDLGAKSVLLETEYVDKDYLDDYSKYYVSCFNRYGERCARLHFFQDKIDHAQIDAILDGSDSDVDIEKLQNDYLGFIVVKPIPKTFIGKTCLKVYDAFRGDKSKNLLTKKYTANLFGIELTIKSIAFQEQDKILSACATTAIWSTLHALKNSDVRNIPSSSEITLSALNHIKNSSNSFPNDGLSNEQILRALDTEKLRHHLVNVDMFDEELKNKIFKVIKIFIDSKVPVILGVKVFENQGGNIKPLDDHAVSVLGYQDADEKILYLHDDRLGPFARARIGRIYDFLPDVENIPEGLDWCIALQEKDKDGICKDPEQIIVPNNLIIPTDKKVRIPVDEVDNTCSAIVDEYDESIEGLELDGGHVNQFKGCLSYSIVLEELSEIRGRVIKNTDLKKRREILTKGTPRLLWTATFYFDGDLAFEVLFDATDIPQGNIISNIIVYNETDYKMSIAHFDAYITGDRPQPKSDKLNYLGAFISFLKGKDCGYLEYLDDVYGELRAPRSLHEEELEGEKLHNQDGVKKYYGVSGNKLEDDFSHVNGDVYAIWAISHDGALMIGEVDGEKGHPTLTGFKPARIAGELWRDSEGWYINSKSGRYSSDYHDTNGYLENAKHKFCDVYSMQESELRVIEYTK